MLRKTVLSTDWGYMACSWSDKGLWELAWPCRTEEEALAGLENSENAGRQSGDEDAQLEKDLNLYFRGCNLGFDTLIDWAGYTDFQRRVLRHTANISYGRVETYGQVALAIDSPKASRAVGQALHINRTPIIVPCHRVIGAGGKLTGFGGGLEMKQALLLLEQG